MEGDWLQWGWLQWRYYERLWDEFEQRGWDLGPARYVNLPPVFADRGPYSITFRYREPATDEGLFEVRQMREGEEREAVLVWGIPTPLEARGLIEDYGVWQPGEVSDGAIDEALACGSPAYPAGLSEGLQPPVVYAESFSKGSREDT